MKGIGTDIIEISRIESAINKTPRFLEKILTPTELEDVKINHRRPENIAGFFAAKEAISKALGTGFRNFTFQDIQIVRNALGKPEVFLEGNAKQCLEALGGSEVAVSISHCQTYAVAFCVIL
jgi:holo-[acyl-carrier protein] synthase